MGKHERSLTGWEKLREAVLICSGRPGMLEKVVPNYEHESSLYPESIRVSFSDGKTVLYDRRIEQPASVIIENIRIIRKWKQGYVNKPMRRRNRT